MHYQKSPIVEALIDIKIEASPDLKFDDLHIVAKSIVAEYPRTETRYLSEGKFTFGEQTAATAERKPFALMLFSSDNKQIFQARTDGMTFSRLAPYQTWNMLRDEARRLWDIYRKFALPRGVIRLAVRYINQLALPGRKIEIEDYLKTFPKISGDLPKELGDIGPFSMRLPVPQADLGGMLVINEAVIGPAAPDTVPIILDLDLYVENLAISDEQVLWSKLEQLRERKNLYFEACITNKTRELIS